MRNDIRETRCSQVSAFIILRLCCDLQISYVKLITKSEKDELLLTTRVYRRPTKLDLRSFSGLMVKQIIY